MTDYRFKTTTTFSPLPSGIRNSIKKEFFPTSGEISSNKSPLPDSLSPYNQVGSSSFYTNYDQEYCNKLKINLSNDNRNDYFSKFFSNNKTWINYTLYSGTKPSLGVSTAGITADRESGAKNDDHRFKMSFLPDYNSSTPSQSGFRGKFTDKSTFTSESLSVSGINFTKFEYSYSTDGVVAPSKQTKKVIDLETSSISGVVDREKYSDLSKVPNLSSYETEVTLRGSNINSNFFDSDFSSSTNRNIGIPVDGFKPPVLKENPETSSTAPPATTTPPTTPAISTTTTSSPITTPQPTVTTTVFPSSPTSAPIVITTPAPPSCN